MATARVIYYSGKEELTAIWPMQNEQFEQQFPGVKAKRWDSFSRVVGKSADGRTLPVTRVIFYKKNPSLHKCDGRCLNAKGGNCECSCGGKNHGAGG